MGYSAEHLAILNQCAEIRKDIKSLRSDLRDWLDFYYSEVSKDIHETVENANSFADIECSNCGE